MKITTTGIVIASASAVVVGTTIFFVFTKTGKGMIKKWFGKKESNQSTVPPSTANAVSTGWKTDTSTAPSTVDTVATGGGRIEATQGRGDAVTKGGGRIEATRQDESTATQGRGADGGWY